MAHTSTFIDLRFPEQLESLSFDKGGEEFTSVATNDLALVDNLTYNVWVKPYYDALIVGCIYAHRGVSPDHVSGNEGSLEIRRTSNFRRVDFVYLDNSQTAVQNQQYGGVLRQGIWQMLTFSWDGTIGGVKMYQNGVEYTAEHTNATDKLKTGNGSDITDTSRTMIIGGRFSGSNDEFDGIIHSSMIWNKQLSDAEVLAVYNDGDGAGFNAERNRGDYQSRSNLLYWHRLALDTTSHLTMAQNYGKNAPIGDLKNTTEFDGSDVVVDAPTGVETLNGLACNFTRTTDDYLRSEVAELDGFGDTFSWSLWGRVTLAGIAEFPRPMHLTTASANNRVSILFDQFERFTINLHNTSGTVFKQYIGPAESLDTWNHYVWTWNGTTLLYYRNAVDITNTTVNKFVDDSGSRAEESGTYSFGALGSQRWAGDIYAPAVWSSVLTSAEIGILYNNAKAKDSYTVDIGSYVSSSTLLHYWDFRLADNRFKDRVGSQDLTDSTVTPDDTDVPT